MPQISKVRIVNFLFDDGRLITDELYDFADSENHVGVNVLINLANGGGKSVLTQLIQQPQNPKAKVNERRIEEFFKNATDHFFVLIEWIKDDSPEKLLTGIAMAAREVGGDDHDSSANLSVKYYTFLSNYTEYDSRFDIVNMALSSKDERGNFVPARYDFVKSLAKKCDGQLEIFSSDDISKYRKRLAAYRISTREWSLLEKFNRVEGGILNYFEELKTSDQLIDKFLIPRIEDKLRQNYSSGDNSLITMFLAYAKQYASQQDVLSEKEHYENFAENLRQLLPLTEGLWTANDYVQMCIARLYGFSDSLGVRIAMLKDEQETLEYKVEALQKDLAHVRLEKASFDYYSAKDRFDSSSAALDAAEATVKSLCEQLHDCKQEIAILECAQLYGDLLKVNGEIAGLSLEIQRQEDGSDGFKALAPLRYSIYSQVNSELQVKQAEIVGLHHQKDFVDVQLREIYERRDKAERDTKNAQSEYDRAKGQFSYVKELNDKNVQSLSDQLPRMLNGFYDLQQFAHLKDKKKQEQDILIKQLDAENQKLQSVCAQLDSLPQKVAEIDKKQWQLEFKKSGLEDAIAEYKKKEQQIYEICTEYGFDFSWRFTSLLEESLVAEQRKNAAEAVNVQRQLTITSEAIQAAERGSVHVPHAVIAYLQSTGVRYTTCEKYLLEQVSSRKITKARCLEILERYPAIAYGVLMERTEKERFFSYGRGEWLPAMFPLFTYEQMALALNNEKKFDGAIAFYSLNYFSDRENFISNLKAELRQLESKISLLDVIDSNLNKQIQIVSSFDYSDSWKSDRKAELVNLNRDISLISKQRKELSDEKESLSTRKNVLHGNIQSMNVVAKEFDSFFTSFEKILLSLEEEFSLADLVDDTFNTLKSINGIFEQVKADADVLEKEQEQIIRNINGLKPVIEDLEKARDEVGICEVAEIIEEHWRMLLEQYRSQLSVMNANLKQLKSRLEHRIDDRNQLDLRLSRYNLDGDLYQNVSYSEEKYTFACEQEKKFDNSLDLAREAEKKAIAEFGQSQGTLEAAKSVLEACGELLPRHEVGAHFDSRETSIEKNLKDIYRQQQQCEKLDDKLKRVYGRLQDSLQSTPRPSRVLSVELSDDEEAQYRALLVERSNAEKQFHDTLAQVQDSFSLLQKTFVHSNQGIEAAISSMHSLLSGKVPGDRYFTLTEHVQGNIENCNRAILQISTDLREIDNNRSSLIWQCGLQGQRIYDGLKQLATSSRVTVYEGKEKKQMFRFDVPSEVDSVVATASIASEIDKGVKEVVEKINTDAPDYAIHTLAAKIVGSSNLLRKYVGRESIRVHAFKIGLFAQSAGYRTWEQTQVKNSGAQRFVVYFAVILSLMNYARSELGGINDKQLSGCLVLDNPFGAITTKELLLPVFDVAKHFRVQLICLSDIDKADVTNCFDTVIKAYVKRNPMSNREILTHVGNERLEHGFYRVEQARLF